MNLRIGSRMQQACRLRAEQTVEAAQNREDGTGDQRSASLVPKGGTPAMEPDREWTPEDDRWRGGESHERKAGYQPGAMGDVLWRGAKARPASNLRL